MSPELSALNSKPAQLLHLFLYSNDLYSNDLYSMPRRGDSGIGDSMTPEEILAQQQQQQADADAAQALLHAAAGAAGGGGNVAAVVDPQVAVINAGASVTLKSQYKIPEYSGRLKHSTYQGIQGMKTELFSAKDFTRQVTIISLAAGWTEEVTAQFVKLAFVPDSPVHDWHENNFDKDFMKTWSAMQPKLIKEFAAYVSVADQVEILRSFRQRQGEAANHYHLRVVKSYGRLLEGLETDMTKSGGDYATETAAAKTARHKIMTYLHDYHVRIFFCLGLKPDILADITKSGKTSLEELLDAAKMSEQASSQQARRQQVAAVDTAAITEDAIIAALEKFQSRFRSTSSSGSKSKSSTSSSKKSNVVCHYCGIKNHYSYECKKRAKDRSNNIWRQKINDSPIPKAEFEKARARANANTEVNTVEAEEDLFAAYFAKND